MKKRKPKNNKLLQFELELQAIKELAGEAKKALEDGFMETETEEEIMDELIGRFKKRISILEVEV